jgi:two-component system, chemotaxis family, sensor kinase Cph1
MSTPNTTAMILFLAAAGLEALIAGSLRRCVLQLRDRDTQLRLVAAELRHRVKNMLAVVMSASRQIGRTSPDQAAFQTAFEARLKALAGAHDILARSGWAGADMRDLVRAHVDPFVSVEGPKLLLEGEDVTLAPDTAVSLSLILHELTTNAVKYGALSTPTGVLTLSWRCDRLSDQLEIDWLERGGPRVEPPRRKGFGTVLIVRTIAPGDRIDFDPEGLHVVATLPFRCRTPTPLASLPDERLPPPPRH